MATSNGSSSSNGTGNGNNRNGRSLQSDGGSYLTSLEQLDRQDWQHNVWDHYRRHTTCRPDDGNKDKCRLMVCHDMQGGYREDTANQGLFTSTTLPTRGDAPSLILPRYVFRHWHLTDCFIYFSHHRITVPPLQWRAAARRNRTPILGTFITEWEAGVSENERLLCGKMDKKESVDRDAGAANRGKWSTHYADLLVDVAVLYGLDGWFMNFESSLEKTGWNADQLAEFVQYLRLKMKDRIPGSVVVWYDSLTIDGKIDWQNCLNENNNLFFPVSDGFFTNYTWKESDPATSVAHAKERRRDVYTGIDLWGRKTFGGGGFDTYKALDVIRQVGTSCALFAPAWTYEHFGANSFLEKDELLWNGTKEAPERGVQHYFEERSRFHDGIYTSFNAGYGTAYFVNGERVHAGPWHHLGLQSPTPHQGHQNQFLKFDRNKTTSVDFKWKYNFDDAYYGGSSLRIWQFGTPTGAHWTHLHRLHFANTEKVAVKVTFKSLLHGDRRGKFGVVLRVNNLESAPSPYPSVKDGDDTLLMVAVSQNSRQIEWTTFETLISLKQGAIVTGCGLFVEPTPGSSNVPGWFAVADFGELSIIPEQSLLTTKKIVKNPLNITHESLDCIENDGQHSVSLALIWDQSPFPYQPTEIDHWNVYAHEKWLGVSLIGRYWVEDLPVPLEMDSTVFKIEAVDVHGQRFSVGSVHVPFEKTWTVINPYK